MSTSDLYAIYRTKATGLREYRNGHGTGPAIWGHLSEHVLRRSRYSWTDAGSELWNLATDPNVPLCLRACLAVTLDYALIPKERAETMGKLLIEGGAITKASAPENVNHFEQIGKDLCEIRLNKRALGFGLTCTSVSDIWAYWKPADNNVFDCFAYITQETSHDHHPRRC